MPGFKQVALPAGDVFQKGRPADFIPGDQALALQIADGDGGAGGQRLLRMADEHQPFMAERIHGQPAPPAGIADQAQVNVVGQRLFLHAVNEVVADADFHTGMDALKACQHGRQLVQADAVAGGQFDDAGAGIPGGQERLLQPGKEPENLPTVLVVKLPDRVQPERPARGQRLAGVPLQDMEHLGDGRLGDVVQIRRPGETSSFGESAEQPQDSRLHKANRITQKGMAVKSNADARPAPGAS